MQNHFNDDKDIVDSLNQVGIQYCDAMRHDNVMTLLTDVDFFCKVIQEEQALMDDEDDSIMPIIQVMQDDQSPCNIHVILLGSSFVFTDKDYVKFITAISHSHEMIIKKSGKNGVKILLRYVL